MSAVNKKLMKKVNKMKFDMLEIEKDRLMEVEHQLKKMGRNYNKKLKHELQVERAKLIINIETIEARREKNNEYGK